MREYEITDDRFSHQEIFCAIQYILYAQVFRGEICENVMEVVVQHRVTMREQFGGKFYLYLQKQSKATMKVVVCGPSTFNEYNNMRILVL